MKIPLTNSSNCVLVDDDKFEQVAALSWRLLNGYPVTSDGKTNMTLPRFLTGLDKTYSIRYKNKNPLDNRLANFVIRKVKPPYVAKNPYEDITGQRFGHILVLKKSNARAQYICRCDCGIEFVDQAMNIKSESLRTGCPACRRKSFIRILDNYAEVEVGRDIWSKIDKEDVPKIDGKFCGTNGITRKNRYVYINLGDCQIGLHRFLMDASDTVVVDHINCDTLDNRKENLRICTMRQNSTNRRGTNKHGFMGIAFDKTRKNDKKPWKAYIKKNYISRHATAEEAARAYDEQARKLYGEFGRYNFPREGEQAAFPKENENE